MNVTHTQLPWSLYRGEICYRSDEDDQSYGMQCPVDLEDDANAAFIVKAVNAHDGLVNALKALYEVLDTFGDLPDGLIAASAWNDCKAPTKLDAARAALAAAGEPV